MSGSSGAGLSGAVELSPLDKPLDSSGLAISSQNIYGGNNPVVLSPLTSKFR